jgi:hypothetical protein
MRQNCISPARIATVGLIWPLIETISVSSASLTCLTLAQAANGFVDYNATSRKFSLSPEQAMVFAEKDSPVYLAGAFDIVAAMIEGEQKVEHSFRTGAGVRWGDSAGCLFCATGAFFRPGYVNNIVQSWLPALDGVEAKLKSGAKVADVGCGVGFSTLLMAQAFPKVSLSATISTRLPLKRRIDMPSHMGWVIA